MLSRDDFFSQHFRDQVLRSYVDEIAERVEQIAVAGDGTTREMFHLCCDITEKCLKQRDKLLELQGDSDDDECYYVPGSCQIGPSTNAAMSDITFQI